MVFTGKSAITSNSSSYPNNLYSGKHTTIYRKRTFDNNLSSSNPASQYQKLKIIQNTVRVDSSNYTMNLGALNVYQYPSNSLQPIYNDGSIYISGGGVNWNQMSDRKSPHTQVAVTASGSTYRGSSTKRTIVSCRPGASSPGGTGCDIKHNSYERYLNRIKGKAPLRRGVIPPGFGSPIPFNRAYPIYGGKVTKTNIVNGCNCTSKIPVDENILFKHDIYKIDNVEYNFNVGDKVYTFYNNKKVVGIILSIDSSNANYVIQLLNGTIINKKILDIFIYSKDKCNTDENCIVNDNLTSIIIDTENNSISDFENNTSILGPDLIV